MRRFRGGRGRGGARLGPGRVDGVAQEPGSFLAGMKCDNPILELGGKRDVAWVFFLEYLRSLDESPLGFGTSPAFELGHGEEKTCGRITRGQRPADRSSETLRRGLDPSRTIVCHALRQRPP